VGENLESPQDHIESPKSIVGEAAIEDVARRAQAVGSPDPAGTLVLAPTPALAQPCPIPSPQNVSSRSIALKVKNHPAQPSSIHHLNKLSYLTGGKDMI
jgi:hypothetical protein